MASTDLTRLFERFARQHKKIRHGYNGRNAFFRNNNDNELAQALMTQVDYYSLHFENANGRLAQTGDISNEATCEFEIRCYVENGDFDAVETVQAEALEIGLNIAAFIADICEDQGNCGPIGNFNEESLDWEYLGPVANGQYGARIRFTYTKSAWDPYTWDRDEYFDPESFIALFDFDNQPLIDDDGQPLIDIF